MEEKFHVVHIHLAFAKQSMSMVLPVLRRI